MSTTVTDRLYESAGEIWSGYHSHPFLTGIGDGTLSPDRFRYFLLQDYLYLYEYAKVFALGVVKARDPALMCRFSESMDAILNGEMNLHRRYMARLGIAESEVAEVRPSMTNLSYTSYMLSVAHSGGPSEVAAAILACSWSYAEIGRRLAQRPGALEHPLFGEWVRGYVSDEYTGANASLIDLMNGLSAGLPEKRLAVLEDIFVRCSRYEAMFWDMAWNRER